jgi:hypothetical protein
VTILVQFVLRLALGMSAAMAITPPRQVTSGYYRNQLYVLLGLNVLATILCWSLSEHPFWIPLIGALICYAGAVCWLYEMPRPGIAALALVSLSALAALWWPLVGGESTSQAACILVWLAPLSGGAVLGVTMAAMLLGHWYLNSPTMQLTPLRRLVALMAVVLLIRMLLCGASLGLLLAELGSLPTDTWMFLALRWAAGLLGPLGLTWMTWQTLKIPNTQSATGILYVAVIGTFVGELTSQLLSMTSLYPL